MAELGAQEVANILIDNPNTGKKDLTDVARKEYIKRTKDRLASHGYGDIDLEDKEKYPEFHSQWVDGKFKSIAKMLNTNSNFAIPVFDPSALAPKIGIPTPKLDLSSIVGTFAAPVPGALLMLKVKPNDLPKKIPEMIKLVVPGPPAFPSLDINLPNINFAPYGALHIMLAFQAAIPLGFVDMFGSIAKPGFWIGFTFKKLFDIATQSMTKGISAPYVNAPVLTPPTTGVIMAESLAECTADMAAFAGVGSTIGCGTIVEKMSESRGYKPKALRENPSLESEAIKNFLYPLSVNSETDGVSYVFGESRDTFFGDAYMIDFLKALGEHMKTMSFKAGKYLVEVGNIAEKSESMAKQRGQISKFEIVDKDGKPYHVDLSNAQPDKLLSYWRWSEGSPGHAKDGKKVITSHSGAAVDIAYPMKDHTSGKRMSGMEGESALVNAKLLANFDEGLPDGSGGPNPLVRAGRKTTPFKGYGNQPLLSDNYDYEALWELLKFIIDFAASSMKEGRVSSNFGGYKKITDPFTKGNFKNFRLLASAACIGPIIYENFKKWITINNKLSETYNGYTGLDVWAIVAPTPNHEDHIHIKLGRTHYDSEAMKQPPYASSYIILSDREAKYTPGNILERAVNYEILIDPETGHPEIITT